MSKYSPFYKQAIAKHAAKIETIKSRTGWGPAAIVKLELQLQQAFCALWKLMQEDALPDSFCELQIPMKAYPYRNPKTSKRNYRQIRTFYKMTDPLPMTQDLSFVTEQFVSSAVFEITQNMDDQLQSVYVTSEENLQAQLFEIPIREIIELLEEVATVD